MIDWLIDWLDVKAVLCSVTWNIPMLLCDSLDGKVQILLFIYVWDSGSTRVRRCFWLIYVPLYLNDSLFKYFPEVSGRYLLHPCYLYFSISIKKKNLPSCKVSYLYSWFLKYIVISVHHLRHRHRCHLSRYGDAQTHHNDTCEQCKQMIISYSSSSRVSRGSSWWSMGMLMLAH